MTNDLFTPALTQKEQVYEFIKSRGRVLSHELNEFGVKNRINNPGTRARELKEDLKIWHVKNSVMQTVYPNSKEICWSVYPADK
jgi:hypothetical protein